MMSSFFPTAVTVVLLTLFSSYSAYANKIGDDPQDNRDKREVCDTLKIGGSFVSSLKTGKDMGEIPAEVVVVTSIDAKKHPSPTVADIFRSEPGLSKGGDGIWATNIHIRGLGENRLVTLANGSRVEVASDLTTSLSMFDVNDIERVEVIKGAQSSIYGSGAIGGIINVITKDGHFSEKPYFSGNATASYSSVNNGHSEYLALYGGGRKWYVKVNGSYSQAGDVATPEGILGNSGYNSVNAGAVAAFKPRDNQVLKLLFQKNCSWDVGIPGGAAFSPDAVVSYDNADRTLASLNYVVENLTGNLGTLTFKAFYQGICLDVSMDPNMAAPQNGAMPTLVTPYAEHRTSGVSAESLWKFGEHDKFTAGAEVWRRAISSEREKYIDQYVDGSIASRIIRMEIPLPDASYTSAGIYVQDEMDIAGGRLILTFGSRADLSFVNNGQCHNVESMENVTTGAVINDPPGKYITFEAGRRTDPSWSANAGLLFKATDRLDMTFNFSRSYRSPALEELFKFIDLAGNKVHFGNPELKAEKGIGGDLGARFHSDKLDLRISGFMDRISNMVIEHKAGESSEIDTLILGNTGQALLYGAEASMTYVMVDGFSIHASGAVAVGLENTAQRIWLPMIPPADLHAGISYDNRRILGADLSVNAAAGRTSGRIADGERPTEGWWRLDFAMYSKIFSMGRCNLQLFGGIDNVMDTAYTNFLSTNRGNIVCEPGRNAYLRVNLTF